MTLVWSARARADRRTIFEHICGPYFDNIAAAIRWDERLVERAKQAARVPNQGHRPRELRDDPDPALANVRQVWVKKYRIIYEIRSRRGIEVMRVIEGHRLLLPGELH